MLNHQLSARASAGLVALALLAVILGAFVFQALGYPPCELCLMQRWAYYVGIPFAAFLALANPRWLAIGLVLLAVLLAANAIFGVYHSGVEWGWWQGPSTCSGNGGLSDGLPDLTKPAVMCNEAAIRILGLSLAGWNAVICAVLAAIAWRGRGYGSSSVSQ